MEEQVLDYDFYFSIYNALSDVFDEKLIETLEAYLLYFQSLEYCLGFLCGSILISLFFSILKEVYK